MDNAFMCPNCLCGWFRTTNTHGFTTRGEVQILQCKCCGRKTTWDQVDAAIKDFIESHTGGTPDLAALLKKFLQHARSGVFPGDKLQLEAQVAIDEAQETKTPQR
jgi:hypothetical protein